jgi:hypothetical protein
MYLERHSESVEPQQFIDESMRKVTMSWLVEVACEYGLQQVPAHYHTQRLTAVFLLACPLAYWY